MRTAVRDLAGVLQKGREIEMLDMSQLGRFLTRRAKLFAMTHISNSLGTINPVVELCARARKLGVKTLVVAAQSAGHRPIDVQEFGCDFLVLSGHKMCGPTGIGVRYARQEVLEEMPPYQGGGEMILTVDFYKSTWKHGAHKFEAGTPDISRGGTFAENSTVLRGGSWIVVGVPRVAKRSAR